MPNLKDIRRRIKSVKNTQKITQAMRMVAAAKVKRAEGRVKAARPYSEALRQLFAMVYNDVKSRPETWENSRFAKLFQPRPIKTLGVVAISSDRGLCGSFNSSVIRQTLRLDKGITEQGLTPKFYTVGRKVSIAVNRYSQAAKLGSMVDMTAAPTPHHAQLIADTLITAFEAGEIDTIDVLSTHFRSMISYKLQMTPLLPLDATTNPWLSEFAEINTVIAPESPASGIPPELLLAPSGTEVLDKLLPLYLGQVIYELLLESTASELAARMTAMANATSNAGDMISKLSIVYNKARQTAITQEILEVVSGANALN